MFKVIKHKIHLDRLASLALARQPSCLMKACKHSGASAESLPEHVVTTNTRGNVILFWHPEKKIPYEHTKPMPEVQAMGEDSSFISSKFKPDMNSKQSKNGPSYKELCDMFYVTKHRFMPKPGMKRAKTDTPKDRNAL